jgi:trehalose 6-phosphate synthase
LSRLFAVSNRVADPVGGKAAGGLAVGLLAALKQYGGVWFGWGGKIRQGDPSDPTIVRRGNISYATIDLFESDYDDYYNGYSNACLWPLCHYMLGFFRYERRFSEAYRKVNALFARKMLRLLEDDDFIWVHDYHLIPLAAELRRAGVTNPIGFFMHVPFPNIDVLRTLPDHLDILRALTCYDVIGFQTHNDVRSFTEGLAREGLLQARLDDGRFRADGREITVRAFPIGIDVDGVIRMASRSGSEWGSTGWITARVCQNDSAPSSSCWLATRRPGTGWSSCRSRRPPARGCAPTRTSAVSSSRWPATSTVTTRNPTGCRSATSTAGSRAAY